MLAAEPHLRSHRDRQNLDLASCYYTHASIHSCIHIDICNKSRGKHTPDWKSKSRPVMFPGSRQFPFSSFAPIYQYILNQPVPDSQLWHRLLFPVNLLLLRFFTAGGRFCMDNPVMWSHMAPATFYQALGLSTIREDGDPSEDFISISPYSAATASKPSARDCLPPIMPM